MSRPPLVVSDLEVRYGSVAAVRGVSFEVSPGEIRGNLDVAAAYLGESAVHEATA